MLPCSILALGEADYVTTRRTRFRSRMQTETGTWPEVHSPNKTGKTKATTEEESNNRRSCGKHKAAKAVKAVGRGP
jgi:hypothetical protein